MAFFQSQIKEATTDAEKEYTRMWLGYFETTVDTFPDLVFIEMHPYLADGDPTGLRKTLDELMDWPVDIVVPGHD